MIAGKLEVTIKINNLPQAQAVEENLTQFETYCDGRIITVIVKPKIRKKLINAASNYPQWVAALSDTLGQPTQHGFVLSEPNTKFSSASPRQR